MSKKDASGAKQEAEKTEKELLAGGREAWAKILPKEKVEMSLEEISEVRNIPLNWFINSGNAPIIIPKDPEGASRGPGRMEPGDIVKGDYYEQVLKEGKPMGMMRMCLVDDDRLAVLATKKAIRDGDELEDWQKEAKMKLMDGDASGSMPGGNPTENLRSVIGQAQPHASEKKR